MNEWILYLFHFSQIRTTFGLPTTAMRGSFLSRRNRRIGCRLSLPSLLLFVDVPFLPLLVMLLLLGGSANTDLAVVHSLVKRGHLWDGKIKLSPESTNNEQTKINASIKKNSLLVMMFACLLGKYRKILLYWVCSLKPAEEWKMAWQISGQKPLLS